MTVDNSALVGTRYLYNDTIVRVYGVAGDVVLTIDGNAHHAEMPRKQFDNLVRSGALVEVA